MSGIAATPEVDVVVPVHRSDRPIARAVDSVLKGAGTVDVRVTVVCHRVPRAEIAKLLGSRDAVRLIDCDDPRPSAAGPANAGFAAATGEFVSRLDSDDTFDDGAIAAWYARARELGSDVLIAPLRPAGGEPIHAPLTRPFRHRRLDGVRDRLSYRTAPFGLIRRGALSQAAPYTEGLEVGEDLEFGLRLWFGGLRVDLAADAPAYVVHDDAAQRTTLIPGPVERELASSRRLLGLAWFRELDAEARRAVIIKLARIHVLGALRNRPVDSIFDEDDRAALVTILDAFDVAAPGWQRPFSRNDSKIFDLLRRGETGAARVAASASSGRLGTLLAPTLGGTLDRESTARRYLRYRLPR